MREGEQNSRRLTHKRSVGMEMADSLDELLGVRENEMGPSTNPGSACPSRPMSAGGDMNGPRLDNLKLALENRMCPLAMCDTDSCGEKDGLMDGDDSFSTCEHNGHETASCTINDLVRLNVGGSVFVTQRSTLAKIPNTRLSRLSQRDPNYIVMTGEWFFDRNPVLFNSFLDFYRTDELHFPHNYCGPSIKKELIFWQIEECEISPCCWNRYREYEQEQRIFDHIERAFESRTLAQYDLPEADEPDVAPTKWERIKKKIYIFMEEPMSSKYAKIWTGTFLIFVLTSIGILCIETHPKLRVPKEKDPTIQPAYTFQTNTTVFPTSFSPYTNTTGKDEDEDNKKILRMLHTVPHPVLEHIDTFLTCFFTIEFILRFVVCPNKLRFFRSVMNIIDILCVLPMWIKYVMVIRNIDMDRSLLAVFFIIMVLRVLRICRVLRLARHYTGVKILLLALKASLRELFMLLVFVFIVILIFAVVIYYAEFFVPDTFDTIPDGYWWAVITLTTVGYGDMYPKSGTGYIVGALCALTGILATGLPVPIIANNFNLYYSHASLKEALSNRKPQKHQKSLVSTENCAITDKDNIPLKEASV